MRKGRLRAHYDRLIDESNDPAAKRRCNFATSASNGTCILRESPRILLKP